MSEKFCIDQQHIGDGALPLEEFYKNPRYMDGRMSVCVTCYARRRQERLGIDAARNVSTYLERHIARREQEDTYQDGEAATTVDVGEMVLYRIEQDNPHAFVGIADGFLRQGKTRPNYSRA